MAVEKETRAEALKHLRGRVLSLGYPDGLTEMDLRDCTMTVVDVKAHKGCEVIADLNEPHEFGEFDFVIDPGTIEHCMNIGVAMVSATRAIAMGGHIIHTAPLSMANHGYFNFCPSFFKDFYEANGIALKRCDVFDLQHRPINVGNKFSRLHKLPPESWALVVGERVEPVRAPRYAVQEIWK